MGGASTILALCLMATISESCDLREGEQKKVKIVIGHNEINGKNKDQQYYSLISKGPLGTIFISIKKTYNRALKAPVID